MSAPPLYPKLKVKVQVAQLSDSLWLHGLYSPWNSPGQNTGVVSLSLLQGTFPTQESSPDLLHCRWIFYQLSHKGSPRILGWVAYPFSSRSSRPRNQTRVSYVAGDSLPTELLLRSKPQRHPWITLSSYMVQLNHPLILPGLSPKQTPILLL